MKLVKAKKSKQMSNEVDKKDFLQIVSMSYECQCRESQLKKSYKEIEHLQKEVEQLSLERKWCYSDGSQVTPSAAQQAKEICQQITNFPHLKHDIVKALRMKKLDLLSNISFLEDQLSKTDEIT